jgi:hypothetical protein
MGTTILHFFFGSMLSQHMCFENMVCNTLELAQRTGLVHFQFLSLIVFFVFHSQMFDQVGFLWRFKVAKCAGIQHIFGIMSLHV